MDRINLKEYSNRQSEIEGILEIKDLWERIKINLIDNTPLYLEWLAWRSILSLNNYTIEEEDITSLIFNKDFEPLRCAPGNIYDLCVMYPFKNLIIEVTERAIAGKVEHYKHLDVARTKYDESFIGLLLTRTNLEKIDLEVWNTYYGHYSLGKPLFVLMDFDLLIHIIGNDNSFKIFKNFIESSVEIWKSSKNWKEIRDKIIKLKESFY
jgi:hypothetical protein